MGLRRNAIRLLGLTAAALAGLYAYGRVAVRRFEDFEPESAGAPGKFRTMNGVRVHYVEAGQGPAVVLVHGWNGSTFGFRYTIPELARHYRVIAPDLIGFGYSERPAKGDYTVTAQVELLRGLMDQFGVEQAAIAGHSMGGAIAMSFALRYPERVSRLILIDAASVREMRSAVRLGRFFAPLLSVFAPLMANRSLFDRGMRSAVHDPAILTPEVLDGYFRPLRMRGHLRGLAQQIAQRGREEPIDPSRLRMPVLVLWGEHDRLLSLVKGEELAAQIPTARLEVIRSAGHLPLEEQPVLCNRLLEEFLDPGQAPRDAHPAAVRIETPG
jgi:pimeloyl-ACP methyl ester carboxylesterase